MAQPLTTSTYQPNYMPAMIATLAALVLAIPLTIFLTMWMLKPQLASASTFNQDANINSGNAVAPLATSGPGCVAPTEDGDSEWSDGDSAYAPSWGYPVAAAASSVEQHQTETNTTNNVTEIFTTTYEDSFNADSYNEDSYNEETDVDVDVDVDVTSDSFNEDNDDTVNNDVRVNDSIGTIIGDSSATN